MHTVIAFDVSDDRRRARLVKALKPYAYRVQKSVFESPSLDQATFLRMRSKIERHIEPLTDTIRYYRLCAACSARVVHHGSGVGLLEPGDEHFRIVGDGG